MDSRWPSPDFAISNTNFKAGLLKLSIKQLDRRAAITYSLSKQTTEGTLRRFENQIFRAFFLCLWQECSRSQVFSVRRDRYRPFVAGFHHLRTRIDPSRDNFRMRMAETRSASDRDDRNARVDSRNKFVRRRCAATVMRDFRYIAREGFRILRNQIRLRRSFDITG